MLCTFVSNPTKSNMCSSCGSAIETLDDAHLTTASN